MGNAAGPSRPHIQRRQEVAAPLRPGRELACDSQPWRCKLGGRSQISSTKWARAGRAARKRFTRRRARQPEVASRADRPRPPARRARARERESLWSRRRCPPRRRRSPCGPATRSRSSLAGRAAARACAAPASTIPRRRRRAVHSQLADARAADTVALNSRVSP